ncbi:choice-of-anchor V domain-containing protein [Fluviicola taffensis]|uniref:Reeler region domain protein n=1 Tax=Fluviicola taffensis (strain DSM 16823 / NCIMB 13979 / RW262) TaxID=755732 RepID=F2IGL2_FLUTR|nr:choice-of-anchor V domain-containing protein [Fluviicola taffensis]AEA42618.1 Reeler region domain protein [Fluviicola taffensis DSM 16823]
MGLLVASGLLLSFSPNESIQKLTGYHALNGAGSPGGRTGAPGDGTCTQCHAGSVQSGSGFNLVTLSSGGNPVTEYLPNTVYQVNVTMSTTNAKNGFEIVALNSNNTMAGTFAITNATHTKTITSGGKTRVTHKSAGNDLASWSFNWTSPATNTSAVTFYLATNQTNSDAGTTGDIIRTSQHVFGTQADVKENTSKVETTIGYSSITNSLNIQLDSKVAGSVFVNVVDLNGKSVFTENMGAINAGESALSVRLDQELNAGIYMVNVSVDNNMTAKKIFISK